MYALPAFAWHLHVGGGLGVGVVNRSAVSINPALGWQGTLGWTKRWWVGHRLAASFSVTQLATLSAPSSLDERIRGWRADMVWEYRSAWSYAWRPWCGFGLGWQSFAYDQRYIEDAQGYATTYLPAVRTRGIDLVLAMDVPFRPLWSVDLTAFLLGPSQFSGVTFTISHRIF